MVNYGVEIAERALKIKAIKLNPEQPFKWASGYYMPIYNDNRMHLDDFTSRKLIAEGFAHIIKERKIEFDIIGGIATAGIPHATTLADLLKKPLIYVRDKPKDHGLRNRIEGIDADKDLENKIVLLEEDLVSTGGSTIKAVHAIRDANGKVKNVFSIFSYDLFEANEEFKNSECELDSLVTYSLLLETAIRTGYLKEDQLKQLAAWRQDPFNWGARNGFHKDEPKKFRDKWFEAVDKKNSILCAGLDPAEYGQRADNVLPRGADKLKWCLDYVEQVASFSAAVKPNRNYIKDFSRSETKKLVSRIHELGMVSIDDAKLTDIGETNDSGFYHPQEEDFDAVTYAAFPGNTKEAIDQAHARGLGIIPLVLMSNKQFEPMKNAKIRGLLGYEYFALQAAENGADAVVVGAPSPDNHIKDSEVKRVKEIVGNEMLVLMPGVGAQGGDAKYIIEVFGKNNVISNVGRALTRNPARAAKKYQEMLNEIRKSA